MTRNIGAGISILSILRDNLEALKPALDEVGTAIQFAATSAGANSETVAHLGRAMDSLIHPSHIAANAVESIQEAWTKFKESIVPDSTVITSNVRTIEESLTALVSGGAALGSSLKDRFLEQVPHALVLDAVGSSETGIQMSHLSTKGAATTGTFSPGVDTAVVSVGLDRELAPGDDEVGWLAQRGHVPLGYLGDAAKTAATYPVIEGTRFAVPGDRAIWRADGIIELLGRDSVTINSGGEKIFAEEVEQAIAQHPAVYDVIVVGRPSEQWGPWRSPRCRR